MTAASNGSGKPLRSRSSNLLSSAEDNQPPDPTCLGERSRLCVGHWPHRPFLCMRMEFFCCDLGMAAYLKKEVPTGG